MKTSSSLLLCVLFSLGLPVSPLRAEDAPQWEPGKTWVFVVGLLEWEHPEFYAPFPAAMKDRRDEQLVEFFQSAGVPEEQVVYLKDAEATKAHTVREFKKFLDQTDDDDLLIFYFAGHGSRDAGNDETWFATYDAGKNYSSAWGVREIFKTIEEHFSGKQVLLLADCCHSGALYSEAKKHRQSKIAYSALTSSYAHNTSTGAWTFSNSLLAGLRGGQEVDFDRDGQITLGEIGKYAEAELAFIEGQKSMLYASKGLPAKTVFATVDEPAKEGVGERLEVEWKGKWYKAKSIDVDGDNTQVSYVGFGSNWDEWVGPDRRRAYEPQQFEVGDKVQVLWKDKKWYPAVVRESWYGLHLVRYDGYDASADEWIGPNAVRLRTN